MPALFPLLVLFSNHYSSCSEHWGTSVSTTACPAARLRWGEDEGAAQYKSWMVSVRCCGVLEMVKMQDISMQFGFHLIHQPLPKKKTSTVYNRSNSERIVQWLQSNKRQIVWCKRAYIPADSAFFTRGTHLYIRHMFKWAMPKGFRD